ncbi:MAG TPA: protein kinase [Candidatus Limnocylindria bacterium]|nr:protein kinase [Candidatus Limnocylindria bacterium]
MPIQDALQTALAGRYRVERELGRGGMATVFLAEDLKHRRRVAVKVLDATLAVAIGPARFLREIEIAARLTHPHILAVHDSGEAGGMFYYVMPFVEGESLRDRLRREKQLPVEEAVRIAGEVADALAYAHGQGVVHRDIKPENILFEGPHAVVADFGIARTVGPSGSPRLTETGLAMGTPAYLSPEQLLSADPDGRSDLYSLACVVYEMLVGQPPFTGATAEAILHQHLSAKPRPIRAVRPTVPARLDHTILRALSKAAADRFAGVTQFAAALAAAPTLADPVRRPPKAAIAAGAAVLAALIGFLVWTGIKRDAFVFGRSPPAPAAPREWVMVADFDGPPDDSSLAVATRDLVIAALDQSGIVAPLPAEQVRIALRSAGKPSGTRVDSELARELAYRSSVRAVVEGRVSRVGRGYTSVLRVVDAESLSVIHSVTGVARNDDALIESLGAMAQELREGLGEKPQAVRATRPLVDAITPSFEAFRLYVRGTGLMSINWNPEAIVLFRQALEIDSEFAAAWSGTGTAYANLGMPDSALLAWGKALEHPGRLRPQQRLRLESLSAQFRGDLPRALALVSEALVHDPGSPGLLNNRAGCLLALGRDEEALTAYSEAKQRMPFGPSEALLWNEATVLLALGRVDEARRVVDEMRSESRWRKLVEVALAADDWATAESLGTAVGAMDIGTDYRVVGLLAAGGARSARGAMRSAAATFRQARDLALTGYAASEKVMAERCLVFLAAVTGGSSGLHPDELAPDSTATGLLTAGLAAAVAGNAERAGRFLVRARARPAEELEPDGATELLEVWLATSRRRWNDAARIGAPLARRSRELGLIVYPGGVTTTRWLVADAFEALGNADSAAHYLELLAEEPHRSPDDVVFRAIAHSLAHQRLSMLYARLGRTEDAARHLRIFSSTFTRPDPDLLPLVAEARNAVASAVAMKRGQLR